MKILKLSLVALGLFVAGILVGHFTAPSHDHDADPPAEDESEPTEYTCSMHPQIRQPNPGTCPICAMDLIPAGKADDMDVGPREISLTEHAKALARIQTTPVERRIPEAEIRLFGRVELDESRVRSITARFPARIEQLYVNYTGVRVQAGEHLAKIYSPELLTAQAELLSAVRFDDARAIRAAREKLKLWGLSDAAIRAMEERREPTDTMDIDSPLGGFVTERMVSEGDYLETGELLFRIADLSTVWVLLDAYEKDKPWLRFGQPVEFTVEALPGRSFEGKIAFIPPVLETATRTFRIRVNVPNEDLALRPGMFVTGIVRAQVAGEGLVLDPSLEDKWISPMHPEIVKDGPGECDVCGMDLVPAAELGYETTGDVEEPLMVPASAVLQTGRRAVVYVEVPDRERPTYEGREIVLGPKAGDAFLVVSGLEDGERVVTNGAFKIDSALQLLAKPSMMSAEEGRGAGDEGRGEVPIDANVLPEVLEGYLALGSALAADDLDTAKEALQEMMETTGHEGELPDLIHTMLDAESLDDMRRPHFEILSESLITALQETPGAVEKPLFLMSCPMVFEDRPDPTGRWLQDDEDLLNPYFGATMLRCGEVEGEVGKGTKDEGPGAPIPGHQH